jgi:hypothetical protein
MKAIVPLRAATQRICGVLLAGAQAVERATTISHP